mmetsp:Transcript_20516/g.66608  ORF Transcript_20516/g.66608 Transcript_20516/m.66608 type:complete len:206 (-) Transcript_20516:12-629(-)
MWRRWRTSAAGARPVGRMPRLPPKVEEDEAPTANGAPWVGTQAVPQPCVAVGVERELRRPPESTPTFEAELPPIFSLLAVRAQACGSARASLHRRAVSGARMTGARARPVPTRASPPPPHSPAPPTTPRPLHNRPRRHLLPRGRPPPQVRAPRTRAPSLPRRPSRPRGSRDPRSRLPGRPRLPRARPRPRRGRPSRPWLDSSVPG